MVTKINTRWLAAAEINAHQYIILHMISLGKTTELMSYLKATHTDDSIREDVDYLHEKGFINEYQLQQFSLANLKTTEKANQLNPEHFDGFQELLDAYPAKVKRPDGKIEYLRVDRGGTRKIYNEIVNNDPEVHKLMMRSLRNELAYREDNGSMTYMRKLRNWLASGDWKKFADNNRGVLGSTNTSGYGEDIE